MSTKLLSPEVKSPCLSLTDFVLDRLLAAGAFCPGVPGRLCSAAGSTIVSGAASRRATRLQELLGNSSED